MRRTKIVATLGPASRNEATVRALVEAGADAFRLNFSYDSHEEHTRAAELVRRASTDIGRPVALIQDLQGPKIRVGRLADGPYVLEAGAEVTVTTRAAAGSASLIPVSCRRLPREVKAGDPILLGDGEAELRVLSTTSDSELQARVVQGGPLKENQGLNLPGVPLNAQAITDKDITDLRLGLRLGVDFAALSFVRHAADIRRMKELVRSEGGRLPVIAKLEKQEAMANLDDILAEADAVMVARGDLGLELPPERVPLLQKEIIRKANERGKLVITATQMLESMLLSPRPTRAEASDVANAILDGTDVVMLSGETAVGRYPVQAVQMMARIAEETEPALVATSYAERARLTHAHAMSRAAVSLAHDVGASAVIVFTRSGHSARLVSNERPTVPLFAFTPDELVYRQLALWWGVAPILMPLPRNAEAMIARADEYLTAHGLLRPGDTVIAARWSPLRARGWSNFVKVHRLASTP